uniref:Uncharacterized protein n=1 Tax=Romanomermis culicivorax TaxID=13658 RepID=A0A915KS95_ROMCU
MSGTQNLYTDNKRCLTIIFHLGEKSITTFWRVRTKYEQSGFGRRLPSVVFRFPQRFSYSFRPKVDFHAQRFKLLTIHSITSEKANSPSSSKTMRLWKNGLSYRLSRRNLRRNSTLPPRRSRFLKADENLATKSSNSSTRFREPRFLGFSKLSNHFLFVVEITSRITSTNFASLTS